MEQSPYPYRDACFSPCPVMLISLARVNRAGTGAQPAVITIPAPLVLELDAIENRGDRLQATPAVQVYIILVLRQTLEARL